MLQFGQQWRQISQQKKQLHAVKRISHAITMPSETLNPFLLRFAVVVFCISCPNFCSAQPNNSPPGNPCDVYGFCGAFGICDPQNSPICSCLTGFYPSNRTEWGSGNWTGGCLRRAPLNCDGTGNGGREDGFFNLQRMKTSGYSDRWPGSEDQCGARCLSICSCLAYGFDPGMRCMFWTNGSLIDVQIFPTGSLGSDLHIRLANSELGGGGRRKGSTKNTVIIVVVVGLVLILFVCVYFAWKWKANNKRRERKEVSEARSFYASHQYATNQLNLEGLTLFKFDTVENATDYFSEANKLGRGGFGPVYKGVLSNGSEFAVKRLSKESVQGMQEFMNEVELISKLQHKNLVRLLGLCVENTEIMLIYEYMPNKSLDSYLFDRSQNILDWRTRFNIIEGICRGLLYLHRDSRLKIIHRDLKPSNILLDNDLNPKISDFGMARIYGTTRDHVSTVRVVGTYGYMAPEFAMEGRFSEKTDVFSLGVLIIEIITGRRNTSFLVQEGSLNLLGHVWELWNEDNVSGLIDPRIHNSSYEAEVLRCMHIGLLCVQEFSRERPSVSAVLSMLSSETMDLPDPKQPAFRIRSSCVQQIENRVCSTNDVTVTMVDGR